MHYLISKCGPKPGEPFRATMTMDSNYCRAFHGNDVISSLHKPRVEHVTFEAIIVSGFEKRGEKFRYQEWVCVFDVEQK